MSHLKKVFTKIYDQYVDKIYRFIFLKVNSQEVAQDLCSETFLRAWQRFQKLSNPHYTKIENPQAFLYQIARNLVISYYREKAKFQVVSAEDNPINDPRQNLEEKTLLDSDLEQIKNALVGLKDDYQNAIIWYYLDGLSVSEVADLLEKTEPATRVLLHRALTALRLAIKEI